MAAVAVTNALPIAAYDPLPPRRHEAPVREFLPCRCGGWLAWLVGQSVEDCVVQHNGTTRHREWRERMEAEG